MHNFKYAIFVLLGGCCYGILSTFVKLAYAAGFSVEAVTIGQYFFGTIISGTTFLFNTKQVAIPSYLANNYNNYLSWKKSLNTTTSPVKSAIAYKVVPSI